MDGDRMSAQTVLSTSGAAAVLKLADVINSNRERLSEIDGAIGDGDHGINMSTGFTRFREEAAGKTLTFSSALDLLGTTLLEVTGGSLGPLYGSMFIAMSEAVNGSNVIDANVFYAAIASGRDMLMEIGGAKPGDKTLLDAICPAVQAFGEANEEGRSFAACLQAMQQAANTGMESTRDLVAKVGRASRLGERSRGVLDAGASSCALILGSLADSFVAELN